MIPDAAHRTLSAVALLQKPVAAKDRGFGPFSKNQS